MAAGQGFKTFTVGEVLTAADVNGYLMQGVLVFATTAARNSAITSPQEGQFAFTKDTNSLWYYDGAAWVASGATGDIEGVTAGVGISGGGTSGTVTVTNSMATAITTNGDVIYGTGSGTFSRLGIGSTGNVLTVASGIPSWAAPAGGGFSANLVLLNSGGTALTGATDIAITVSSKDYYVIFVDGMSSANASSYLGLRFNSDSGSKYRWNELVNKAGVVTDYPNGLYSSFNLSRMGTSAADTVTAFAFVWGGNATGIKSISSFGSGTGAAREAQISQGISTVASAITTINILSSTGNFDAGTAYIYGA